MENLLTVEETAEKLKKHPENVREFLRDGQLAGVKLGRSWRVRESDLTAFIAPRVRPAHDNGAAKPKGNQAAKVAAFLKLADELRPMIENGTSHVENFDAAAMIRDSHDERDRELSGDAAHG
jgi:excisionase family DNA binding protein